MGFFDRFAQSGKQGPPRPRMGGHEQDSWVLKVEHGLLRVVSLCFSFGSAYAIGQVFNPHNGDTIRLAVDLMIAAGFGVLGYFLSRSIAYRLMKHETVWAYIPICLVVELVEIFCNYVMGVSEVPHALWLQSIPLNQRPFITIGTYVVLSIIPAVTLFLAVVDMDLERRKLIPQGQPKTPHVSTYPQGQQGSYQGGYQGQRQGVGGPMQAPQRPAMPPLPQRPAMAQGQVQGGQPAAVPLAGVTH